MHVSRRVTLPVAGGTVLAVIAALCVALLGTGRAHADVVTIGPSADSYISSGSPDTNYGTSTYVYQDASPTKIGLYQFTVSVPGGQQITDVTFSCYSESVNSTGFEIRTVGNGWTETGVTYNNGPKPNMSLPPTGVSGPTPEGAYITPINVTSAFGAGAGVYSLATTTTSTVAFACASRTNSGNHPPKLVVTTSPNPSPSPTPATTSPSSTPTTTSPSSTPTTTSPSPTPTTTTPSPSPTTIPHANTTLPARGTFNYEWFPEAWNQGGINPATHYNPTLGFYNSVDVQASHVQSMVYGNFDFTVSSWWGQGHYTDTRLGSLLTAAHGTSLKVAPYYEAEGNATSTTPGSPNPAATQITADLNYLAAHYINDPNYMYVNNKPVVFVYGDSGDGCSMADRWAQGNAAATTRFYVVLKVFAGYAACASQPDNWHQYGPGSREDLQGSHSISISPGYWKYTDQTPLLSRDVAAFTTAVNDMNCAAVDFKLVTTFNEWGEGTSLESATQWGSASGQGDYLDVLHNNTACSTNPTPTPSPTPTTTSPSPTPTPTSPSPTPTPTSPSPTPTTTSPSPTPTPTTTPPVTGLPHYDHIFVVMEENKQYSDIMADPNVQSFVAQGSIGDHDSAITHPSVNNYLADVSGQTYTSVPPAVGSAITDSCTPVTTSCSTNAWNLFDGVEAAGKTWGQYAENQPTPCYLVHDNAPYVERHTYANYFNQIRNNPSRCANGKPYTSLATDLASAATTPNLVMITPNLNNDMHDGSVATGGTWLKNNMPAIMNSPAWTTQHSLLIITEDENDGTNPVPQTMPGGIVPLIFISSDSTVTPHKVDHTVYNQYDTLRTIEDSLGVTPGGPGDKAGFDEIGMFH